jgi:alcohol/geraniol dehydrogenase (NADP+)
MLALQRGDARMAKIRAWAATAPDRSMERFELAPISVAAFDLIMPQRRVSGSPTGSPATISEMLEFAARLKIPPKTEHFPLDRVKDAMAHPAAGNARYRIVLDI